MSDTTSGGQPSYGGHPVVQAIASTTAGDPDVNSEFQNLAQHIATTASPEHVESLLAKVLEVWKSVSAIFDDKIT